MEDELHLRRRFQAYGLALRDLEMAEAIEAKFAERRRADPQCAATASGLALARLRKHLAGRRADQATAALTRGRSMWEVLWSLPDDL